jgi:hypothetical protein
VDTSGKAQQVREHEQAERGHDSVDAYADISAQLTSLHTFLRARAAETPVVTPLFHESLGYAMGYAEACMEKRDIVGAVRKLEWMRNEAKRWADHPVFPTEARR